MEYSPVIIPTLNRVGHISSLLESLKVNKLSCFTDIYIGLDYPPSDAYKDEYEKMKVYLEGDFSCFKSFNVVTRSKNLGYLRNVDDLISRVLEKYDRFIYMDDDLEVSPNFLEYMNSCLELYKSDQDVIAVCGYSYPLEWSVSRGATLFKESFVCPMWGTGFWRDKYVRMRKYIEEDYGLANDADLIIKGRGIQNMSNVCCREYVDLCLSPDYKNTLAAIVTDISIRMYMSSLDRRVIMPVISKVRNWGFDGTGEFCSKIEDGGGRFTSSTYSYNSQPIDGDNRFCLIPDTLNDIKANKILMNKFDTVSFNSRVKTYLKLFLFFILGLSNYHRATLALRRLRSYGK